MNLTMWGHGVMTCPLLFACDHNEASQQNRCKNPGEKISGICLARPPRSHSGLHTFPCVPKIKRGKCDCLGQMWLQRIDAWLISHPTTNMDTRRGEHQMPLAGTFFVLEVRRSTDKKNKIKKVWQAVNRVGLRACGTSPSSGGQGVCTSSPPGGSAAGEYQASITSEKAPCGDRQWETKRLPKCLYIRFTLVGLYYLSWNNRIQSRKYIRINAYSCSLLFLYAQQWCHDPVQVGSTMFSFNSNYLSGHLKHIQPRKFVVVFCKM